jgi:hypothetical protein
VTRTIPRSLFLDHATFASGLVSAQCRSSRLKIFTSVEALENLSRISLLEAPKSWANSFLEALLEMCSFLIDSIQTNHQLSPPLDAQPSQCSIGHNCSFGIVSQKNGRSRQCSRVLPSRLDFRRSAA